MSKTIGWGILGTGRIARQFAEGLKILPNARLIAVGSRTAEQANAFGKRFEIQHCHPSYESLVNDPQVDVIYVATPHSLHQENALLALSAGKAVLCEKPFAINARQAEEVIASARRQKLFLMEAMWTRCFPLMTEMRGLLKSQAIGEVRMLTADFGFRAEYHEEDRLFAPSFGGGALLDVGVYPVSLASMLFGTPARITALAHLGTTGVDEASAMLLSHAQGQLAVLHAAIRVESPQEAVLLGTAGRIRIHSEWWRPTAMTLSRDGGEAERMEFPHAGNGYQFEAAEVMKCLQEGRNESSVMPLDETLSIMKTLDVIRAQCGLKYPME